MGSLSNLLGRTIYFDANIFIYILNGFQPFKDFLKELFEARDEGSLIAVTSDLTAAEVLVAPFRDSDVKLEQECRAILEPDPGLDVVPITRSILEHAARLRAANLSLRLLDAIHLATAIASGCDVVLTNDQHFKAARDIPVMLLSEMV